MQRSNVAFQSLVSLNAIIISTIVLIFITTIHTSLSEHLDAGIPDNTRLKVAAQKERPALSLDHTTGSSIARLPLSHLCYRAVYETANHIHLGWINRRDGILSVGGEIDHLIGGEYIFSVGYAQKNLLQIFFMKRHRPFVSPSGFYRRSRLRRLHLILIIRIPLHTHE